jgi:hypothetical protein
MDDGKSNISKGEKMISESEEKFKTSFPNTKLFQ